MTKFGDILSELRKDKALTQRQLAEEIRVSTSTISNYEIGAHYPDIEKLIELADFFDVSTDYLLGRCTATYSPDVFQTLFLPGVTIDDMLQLLNGLTPEQKSAVLVLLRAIKGSNHP